MSAEYWRGIGWVHDQCKARGRGLNPDLKRADILAWVRTLRGERCAICARVNHQENGLMTLSSEASASCVGPTLR